MDKLQAAIARALGCGKGDALYELRDLRGEFDPADPVVYEAVVKLAVEKDPAGYLLALQELVCEDGPVHVGEQFFVITLNDLGALALADSDKRIRAALKVLGYEV